MNDAWKYIVDVLRILAAISLRYLIGRLQVGVAQVEVDRQTGIKQRGDARGVAVTARHHQRRASAPVRGRLGEMSDESKFRRKYRMSE